MLVPLAAESWQAGQPTDDEFLSVSKTGAFSMFRDEHGGNLLTGHECRWERSDETAGVHRANRWCGDMAADNKRTAIGSLAPHWVRGLHLRFQFLSHLRHPLINVLGGCYSTDYRHVEQIANACRVAS